MKRYFRQVFYLGLLCAGLAGLQAAPPPVPFASWGESLLRPGESRSIAHGNGVFVIVGDAGAVMYSTNAANWFDSDSQTGVRLNSVTFGAGKFVAVGGLTGSATNVVLVSQDGVNWTASSIASAGWLSGVAYGNGRFVAGGREVFTSVDGIEWSRQQLNNPAGLPSEINALTYGNGKFVAVGQGVSTTSADGVNWSPLQSAASPVAFRQVTFGNGVFVAVGGTYFAHRSEDGVTWTSYPVLPPAADVTLSGVTFGGGLFVVAGPYAVSTDGVHWQTTTPVFTSTSAMGYGDGTFVAAGSRGSVASSSNGVAWTVQRASKDVRINAVAVHDGTAVAVGFEGALSVMATVYRSTDGILWRGGPLEHNESLMDVTFDGTDFLAVGSKIFASRDGRQWRTVHQGVNLRAITVGNGRRVAVGSGGSIVASTNGVDWISTNSVVSGSFNAVTYGAGMFVAVGGPAATSAVLATSPDGINWTRRDPGPGNILTGVTYGNGWFVAVRWYGPLLVSSNGVDWQSIDLGGSPATRSTVTASSLGEIHHVDGWFIARDAQTYSGWASGDWKHWTKVDYVPWDIVRYNQEFLGADYGGVRRGVFAGPPFEVSIESQPAASEAGETGGFIVHRAGPPGIDLPVAFKIGGTAENGVDFETLNNFVVIPAGQTSVVAPIRPLPDLVEEPVETVVATLQPETNYTVGADLSATVLIYDPSHSPRFAATRTTRLPDGTVKLWIELPPNVSFQLEVSNDLKTWRPLQAITGGTSAVEFRDGPAPVESSRFYRLRRN